MSEITEKMKELGTELAQSLFPHERHAVVDELIQLGEDGWHSWFWRRMPECMQYLAATPATRTKWSQVNGIHTHRKPALGALVLHRAAIVFQGIWEQHDTHMGFPFGDKYRDFHKLAAKRGLDATYHLRCLDFYPLEMLDLFSAIAEGAYFEEHPSFPYCTYSDLLIKRIDPKCWP